MENQRNFTVQLNKGFMEYKGTVPLNAIRATMTYDDLAGEVFFDDAVNHAFCNATLENHDDVGFIAAYEEFSPSLRASHAGSIKSFIAKFPRCPLAVFVDLLVDHSAKIMFTSLADAGGFTKMPKEFWFESERYELPQQLDSDLVLCSISKSSANAFAREYGAENAAVECWRWHLVYSCVSLFSLMELTHLGNTRVDSELVQKQLLLKLKRSLLTEIVLNEIPLPEVK